MQDQASEGLAPHAAFWTFPAAFAASSALIVPGVDGAEIVTYDDLSARADLWRERIVAASGPESAALVALEFETSVEAIAAYVGALRSGCPLLVIEPGQLAQPGPISRIYAPEIVLGRRGGRFDLQAAGTPSGVAAHPDLKLLLSTSGSTGDPKLVRLSALNIDSNARAIADYLAIRATDRAATTLPLFYSYGLSVLNSHLAAGAALVLTEDSVAAPEFWATCRATGVTSLAFVPHQFELLDAGHFARLHLPSLRYVTQAGGRLGPDLARRVRDLGRQSGWDLVIMYGQTEAAPRIAYVPPELLPEAADTIGRAIPGGRLRILGEDGAEITAPGRQGELVYEGPNVMMGYAERREDLSRGKEVTELRTGDLAERTASGLFRIVGRSKRFVKLFGLRLSLDQIEALLEREGIAARAVASDDRLVLLHARADQGQAARSAVARTYGIPIAQVHAGHLAETPLLPSGKVDQRALVRHAADLLAREAARPQKRPDTSLADVLRQATRSPEVGPADSFVSLGGDSLSYLEMQLELEQRLGAAPDGWERMPLGDLERLATQGTPKPGRSRIGIDVPLRLGAISMVVGQHATDYPLFGGTWALLLLMGFTLGRFQTDLLRNGEALRFGQRMLYPILPLYAVLTAAYAGLHGGVPDSYMALLGNYHVWTESSALEPYWFVSLYTQVVLVVGLASLLPPVRRGLARRAWASVGLAYAVAIGVLGTGIAVLGGQGLESLPVPHHAARDILVCLPVVLLGWMLQSARTPVQRVATLLAGVALWLAVASLNGAPGPRIVLAGAILLLAWSPSIPAPRLVARLLQQLASVTLFVYLLHVIVVSVASRLPVGDLPRLVFALVLSFALGALAKAGFDWLERLPRPVWTRPPRHSHP
ncbi:AMP-binding protein [Rubellimicrobium arenae]|uniref:AMP-binding protein n=1 Tax=Rubellimicrobium arenae TaxID=2817372 RepID=UPI001B30117E|nr:AMP-binding protein [Rubellimicrobium arenae]